MKVFLSWSGSESKRIAEIFKDWLKSVIQSTEPWISADIEKGESWDYQISERLKNSPIGIICLTPNNLDNNWLLFEAGAIYSNDNSKVCTILWNLKPSDIKPPLDKFQHTEFKEEEIFKLIKTINGQLNENKLDDEVLKNTFNTWWPLLEKKISEIQYLKGKNSKIRTDRDLLEEILDNTRLIQNQIRKTNKVEENLFNKYIESYLSENPKKGRITVEIQDLFCPKCLKKDIEIIDYKKVNSEKCIFLCKCLDCGELFTYPDCNI